MAFNFGGGTPAPAAPAAPAPAAAAGGGFSFAAPSAAAPAAAAPAPAAAGGFSFGGATPAPAPAGATAAAAPAAAGGTGFSFGAPAAPAPAAAATPAPAPAAAPTTGGGGGGLFGASAPAPAPTAPGPTPAAAAAGAAPTLGNTSAASSSSGPTPAATIPPYHATFPYLVVEQRLREVLGRVTTQQQQQQQQQGSDGYGNNDLDAQELMYLLQTTGGGGGGGASSGASGGDDGPVGHLLSKPEPLTMVPPDPALRQKLRANPYVLLQRDVNNSTNGTGTAAINDSGSGNDAGGTIAGMTPQILREIETLSDDLRISETDAASLYAGASDVTNRRWLEGRLDRSFVGAAVAAGRANDGGGSGGANGQQQQQQRQQPGLSTANSADAAAGTGASTATSASASSSSSSSYQDDPLSPPRFGEDVLRAAQELYFHERSCLLSSLLMLIRARVEASSHILLGLQDADGMASASVSASASASSARAVLQATDQLIENDLVGNLVQLARDLTTKITDIGRQIAEGRMKKAAAAAAPPAPVAAPAAPAPLAFGAFGAAPQPAPAPAAAPAGPAVRDMDHALLAFAYQSRQTVAECLFYLAYHTQLTGKEVGSIIDLVQDLTNGSGWERKQGGLGCGLPILDPIGNAPNVYAAALAAPPQYGSVSPSAPVEKEVAAWESELVGNLWDGAGSRPPAPDSVGPGIPHLLQCTGTLVMTVICALDPGQVLMDRKTHGPNAFGVVSVVVLQYVSSILLCACILVVLIQSCTPFFFFFFFSHLHRAMVYCRLLVMVGLLVLTRPTFKRSIVVLTWTALPLLNHGGGKTLSACFAVRVPFSCSHRPLF